MKQYITQDELDEAYKIFANTLKDGLEPVIRNMETINEHNMKQDKKIRGLIFAIDKQNTVEKKMMKSDNTIKIMAVWIFITACVIFALWQGYSYLDQQAFKKESNEVIVKIKDDITTVKTDVSEIKGYLKGKDI